MKNIYFVWTVAFTAQKSLANVLLTWFLVISGFVASIVIAVKTSITYASVGIGFCLALIVISWWTSYVRTVVSIGSPTNLRWVPGLRRDLALSTTVLWLFTSVVLASLCFVVGGKWLLYWAGFAFLLCILAAYAIAQYAAGLILGAAAFLPVFFIKNKDFSPLLLLLADSPILVAMVVLLFFAIVVYRLLWASNKTLLARQKFSARIRDALVFYKQTGVSATIESPLQHWLALRTVNFSIIDRALKRKVGPRQLLMFGMAPRVLWLRILYNVSVSMIIIMLLMLPLIASSGEYVAPDEILSVVSLGAAIFLLGTQDIVSVALAQAKGKREQGLLLLLPHAPTGSAFNRWFASRLITFQLQALVITCAGILVMAFVLGYLEQLSASAFIPTIAAGFLSAALVFKDYAHAGQFNYRTIIFSSGTFLAGLVLAIANIFVWKVPLYVWAGPLTIIFAVFAVYRYVRMLKAPRSLPYGWLT